MAGSNLNTVSVTQFVKKCVSNYAHVKWCHLFSLKNTTFMISNKSEVNFLIKIPQIYWSRWWQQSF